GEGGTGVFTVNVSELTAGTTYYYRAYATNSEGTAYGEEVSFVTQDAAPSLWDGVSVEIRVGGNTYFGPEPVGDGDELDISEEGSVFLDVDPVNNRIVFWGVVEEGSYYTFPAMPFDLVFSGGGLAGIVSVTKNDAETNHPDADLMSTTATDGSSITFEIADNLEFIPERRQIVFDFEPDFSAEAENIPPVASDVNFGGELKVGATLTGDYQFEDEDEDEEGA